MDIPDENPGAVSQEEDGWLVNALLASTPCHANDVSKDPAERHRLNRMEELNA